LNSSSNPRFRKPALRACVGGVIVKLTSPTQAADVRNAAIRTIRVLLTTLYLKKRP
jgi:hypothetical protein